VEHLYTDGEFVHNTASCKQLHNWPQHVLDHLIIRLDAHMCGPAGTPGKEVSTLKKLLCACHSSMALPPALSINLKLIVPLVVACSDIPRLQDGGAQFRKAQAASWSKRRWICHYIYQYYQQQQRQQ